MGAWGAIIMSFFGALFASMTLALQLHWTGALLVLPFVAFAAITVAAIKAIRMPGEGIRASERAERVIMWSSIAEGVGLFIAANLAINLGRRDLLLPAMALVVGLHFLPIARAVPFRPFYVLGFALLASALFGFAMGQPAGGTVAGFAAAAALLTAAALAVQRDMQAKSA